MATPVSDDEKDPRLFIRWSKALRDPNDPMHEEVVGWIKGISATQIYNVHTYGMNKNRPIVFPNEPAPEHRTWINAGPIPDRGSAQAVDLYWSSQMPDDSMWTLSKTRPARSEKTGLDHRMIAAALYNSYSYAAFMELLRDLQSSSTTDMQGDVRGYVVKTIWFDVVSLRFTTSLSMEVEPHSHNHIIRMRSATRSDDGQSGPTVGEAFTISIEQRDFLISQPASRTEGDFPTEVGGVPALLKNYIYDKLRWLITVSYLEFVGIYPDDAMRAEVEQTASYMAMGRQNPMNSNNAPVIRETIERSPGTRPTDHEASRKNMAKRQELLSKWLDAGQADIIKFMVLNQETAAKVKTTLWEHNIPVIMSHLEVWTANIDGNRWAATLKEHMELPAMGMVAGVPIDCGKDCVHILDVSDVPCEVVVFGNSAAWYDKMMAMAREKVEIMARDMLMSGMVADETDAGDPFQWIEI